MGSATPIGAKRLTHARRAAIPGPKRRDEDRNLLRLKDQSLICAPAESCQELHNDEPQLFLGSVEIERDEHILTGERRCLYRINPRRQRA